jgi:hypothetical protein
MFDTGLEKLPRSATKMITLTALLAALVSYVGCAETPSEEMGAASLSAKDCAKFSSLMKDPQFETLGRRGSVWRYTQHTGVRSFATSVEDGRFDFSRIGNEPWGIVRQKITDPLLSGRTVRYSADLKGDVSDLVTHGFGAKSGLYLRYGQGRATILAEHEPNVGQWDWQRVELEVRVPEGFDYVEVGFLYQGGEGVLSARAPKVELLECLP